MSHLFINNMNSYNSFLSEAPSRNIHINDTKHYLDNNNGQDKTLQEIWSTENFQSNKTTPEKIDDYKAKTSWANKTPELKMGPLNEEENKQEKREEEEKEEEDDDKALSLDIDIHQNANNSDKDDSTSPSHHARRPMNAFLIFCKKHRPVVRQRFPNLENRGVTRILGEWWALLDSADKQPYTDLAKEYKDAFLSANPDFKWYKLPAPPLRTLSTRPIISKATLPVSSPSNNVTMVSEFTPGKLADESQLGGLTSLMNNNFSPVPKEETNWKQTNMENNNNNRYDNNDVQLHDALSPVSLIKTTVLPPKPIKKRLYDTYNDSKSVARNLLPNNEDSEEMHNDCDGDDKEEDSDNMTKQELLNIVVESMFSKDQDYSFENNGLNTQKEVRKSDRLCKGKRYEKFMVEGKLLGNKRDTKLTQQKLTDTEKFDSDTTNKLFKVEGNTPKLDLKNTIKRLAERTNVKLNFENQKTECAAAAASVTCSTSERVRTISETSDCSSKNSPTTFNLEIRIQNLPSLSYDEFVQRKRESKKRKSRTKVDSESKQKIKKQEQSDMQLVGSKKRKNKQSIIHLGNNNDTNINSDLLGLATLAEVAANTEKIDERVSE